MAESIDELKRDRRYWQRLLRLARFYTGAIDGILGRQSRAAEARWKERAETIKRELGSFDSRTERNLATLLPETQRVARQWLALAKPVAEASGCDVRIIGGTRTYSEQDALYSKRPRVTKARAGSSMHNFGLAWDVGVFEGSTYLGEHPLYEELGKLHSQIPGLTWGGTWKSFVDRPHYQVTRFTTSAAARKAFEA